MNRKFWLFSLPLSLILPFCVLSADEGMWPLNQVPVEYLKETYGFEPEKGWIEAVQKSCLRMGKGGSASFVSRSMR